MIQKSKPIQILVLTFLLFTMLTACTTAEDSYSEPTRTMGPSVTPLPTKTEVPTRTPRPTSTITPIPTALPVEIFEGGLVIMEKKGKGYDLFEIYSPLDEPMQTYPIAGDVTRVEISPDGKSMIFVIGGDKDNDIKSKGTYLHTFQTMENILVNKDALSKFRRSPNNQWISAIASNDNWRNANQAIFILDWQGNQYKAHQPDSASYQLNSSALPSNSSLKVFGHFSAPYWYDSQNIIFRFYNGRMPQQLSVREEEIQENDIGTYNILSRAGKSNTAEEAVEEAADETEIETETIVDEPIKIVKIEGTEENLDLAEKNDHEMISFDGSWALFQDYPDYVWQVGKFNESTHSYVKTDFTPCQDCETYGFVPNSNDIFYLQKTDTSYKIFTTSPQNFDPQLVGSFTNHDFCEVETGEVDKSAIWNGTWVGDISDPTIAFIEKCIIQGEGGHQYVSIMDLSDNTKTRLYEVNFNAEIVTWTPPKTITEEEPTAE